MKWYKYLPKQFADDMVTNGCIKLSMLSYYRDIEAHGDAVGDTKENTRIIYSHDKDVKTSLEQLNPLEKRLFFLGGAKVENFHFEKNRIEILDKGDNLIAYCASNEFNKDSMERISKENIAAGNDAYDACVEISDHVDFVKTIEKFLVREYGFKYKGHGDCHYNDRLVHWSQANNVSSWYLKELKYQYQSECRIVLVPPESFNEQSLIIYIPDIVKYCRFYEKIHNKAFKPDLQRSEFLE